jgi:hypothetical protein
MTPAASAGTLTIELDTNDLYPNVSIVLNVSGITGTETENQLSFEVYTQLTTYYTQTNHLYYNVPPGNFDTQFPPYLSFPDQVSLPLFGITRTDHVICIMSQCGFDITISNNTTGSTIVQGDTGVLLTVKDFNNIAPITQTVTTDVNGTPFTEAQIIYMLNLASSDVIKFLRNFITSTTILEYNVCNGERDWYTKKSPIIDFYAPVVRRPTILSIQQITTFGTVKSNFSCDRNRGRISYRFAQDFLVSQEPFEQGNEVMIAYIAGYKKIPLIIKEYVMRFTAFLCNNNEYEDLDSEGYKTTIKARLDVLKSFTAELSEYFNA